MKEHVKFLLMILVVSLSLFLSYVISLFINGIYQIDSTFSSLVSGNEAIIYLIVIKLFIFVLFMIFQQSTYMWSRGALGIATGNICVVFYLLFSQGNIQNYGIFVVNTIIDTALVIGILILFNLLIKSENSSGNIQKFIEIEDDDSNIEDLKDIDSELDKKVKLLQELDKKIEEKEMILNKAVDNVQNNTQNKINYSPTNSIEFPLRIEIGEKAKYISGNSSKHPEETRRHRLKDEKSRKEREKEFEIRKEQLDKKEEIIEKTIINLEQISKNIKDRMKTLEEKEEYIKSQLEIIDNKQEENTTQLQNKIYDTIFNSPDIYEDEVKLQDDQSEIIIDKEDLLELRKLIEEMSSQEED